MRVQKFLNRNYHSLQSNYDVVVVGGGQAGLCAAHYLSKYPLSFAVLDAGEAPGGAWNHRWKSLQLFSDISWSSLPGLSFDGAETPNHYPYALEMAKYLASYETRFHFPVFRPVRVVSVTRDRPYLRLSLDNGATLNTRALVCATGTHSSPFFPDIPGRCNFLGLQIHSSDYREPSTFLHHKVAVVGEGNSGAQIVAELSGVARSVTWVTLRRPRFHPPQLDGRGLFTALSKAIDEASLLPSTSDDVRMDACRTRIAKDFSVLRRVLRVPGVEEAAARALVDLHQTSSGAQYNSAPEKSSLCFAPDGILRPRPPFARLEKGGAVWHGGSSRGDISADIEYVVPRSDVAPRGYYWRKESSSVNAGIEYANRRGSSFLRSSVTSCSVSSPPNETADRTGEFFMPFDSIVWCTGNTPATQFLDYLKIRSKDGRCQLCVGNRMVKQPVV